MALGELSGCGAAACGEDSLLDGEADIRSGSQLAVCPRSNRKHPSRGLPNTLQINGLRAPPVRPRCSNSKWSGTPNFQQLALT